MRLGILFLVVGYVLSQFYRACLAVMTPVLSADIGASAQDLALSSGLWFLIFAAMQIPVGWALDEIGPRRTASLLLAIGGAGGAAVFALAQGPGWVHAAMLLIGVGCSPVLMASYYIFARSFPPAVFGTLAGAMIGFGSLGNLAGSLPLAWAVEAFGWRESLWVLAVVTVVVAAALFLFVKDPEKAVLSADGRGSLLDLLKMPALWLILPLMAANYFPAAGLRGLWAGPFFSDVFGMDATGIGQVTLLMGAAMIIGNFAYGPLDRLFGTRKWVVFVGNALGVVCLVALAMYPGSSIVTSAALVALIGLFGSSFPLMMAHGRALFPPHLMGRGVTFLNLFGIGGVGLMQLLSGPLFDHFNEPGAPAEAAYSALFLVFAAILSLSLVVYLFSSDTKG